MPAGLENPASADCTGRELLLSERFPRFRQPRQLSCGYQGCWAAGLSRTGSCWTALSLHMRRTSPCGLQGYLGVGMQFSRNCSFTCLAWLYSNHHSSVALTVGFSPLSSPGRFSSHPRKETKCLPLWKPKFMLSLESKAPFYFAVPCWVEWALERSCIEKSWTLCLSPSLAGVAR